MASLRAARSDKPEIGDGQFALVPMGPRDKSPFIECLPRCALLSPPKFRRALRSCSARVLGVWSSGFSLRAFGISRDVRNIVGYGQADARTVRGVKMGRAGNLPPG